MPQVASGQPTACSARAREITSAPLRTAVIEQAGLAARCLYGLGRLGADGLPAALTTRPGLRVRKRVEVVAHGRLLTEKLTDALNARPGLVHVTDVPDFDRRPLPFLQLGSQALSALVILRYYHSQREASGNRYAPDLDSNWNALPGWEWDGQDRLDANTMQTAAVLLTSVHRTCIHAGNFRGRRSRP